MRTPEDLLSLAAYCRDRVNPQMFVYCLSVVLLHREDTKHLKLPSLNQIFPDMFVETKIFTRARIDANVAPNGIRVNCLKQKFNLFLYCSPRLKLTFYSRLPLKFPLNLPHPEKSQNNASPTSEKILVRFAR